MPIFYMLCMKNKNKRHEGIAVELALSAVIASIGEARPSAILIDKHKISLNPINKVISNDIYCWRFFNATKVQIIKIIHLYHFHMMKVWSENLLTAFRNRIKRIYGTHYMFYCIVSMSLILKFIYKNYTMIFNTFQP